MHPLHRIVVAVVLTFSLSAQTAYADYWKDAKALEQVHKKNVAALYDKYPSLRQYAHRLTPVGFLEMCPLWLEYDLELLKNEVDNSTWSLIAGGGPFPDNLYHFVADACFTQALFEDQHYQVGAGALSAVNRIKLGERYLRHTQDGFIPRPVAEMKQRVYLRVAQYLLIDAEKRKNLVSMSDEVLTKEMKRLDFRGTPREFRAKQVKEALASSTEALNYVDEVLGDNEYYLKVHAELLNMAKEYGIS